MSNVRQVVPRFGNEFSARAWEVKAERLRALGVRRGFEFIVAPMGKVMASDGRLLTEGMEVRLSDFTDTPARPGDPDEGRRVRDPRPPWRRLRDAVDQARVLECYAVASREPEPPPDEAA